MTKIRTYKIKYTTGLSNRYKLIDAPNKQVAKQNLRNLYKYEINILEVSEVK